VNNSEVEFLFVMDVMDGGENIVTKYYGWQTNNLETERPSKKKLNKKYKIKIMVLLAQLFTKIIHIG